MFDSSKTSKSKVTEELDQLRQKGLAKTQRGKFKDSDTKFRTPEEAKAFLDSVRVIKNKQENPTPPTNLAPTDLNDWYSQQRQRELAERKNRDEAEKFLRGYRSKFEYANDVASPKKKGSATLEDADGVMAIEEEGVDDVLAAVEKLEEKFGKLETEEEEVEKLDEAEDGVETVDDDVDDEGETDAEIESSESCKEPDIAEVEELLIKKDDDDEMLKQELEEPNNDEEEEMNTANEVEEVVKAEVETNQDVTESEVEKLGDAIEIESSEAEEPEENSDDAVELEVEKLGDEVEIESGEVNNDNNAEIETKAETSILTTKSDNEEVIEERSEEVAVTPEAESIEEEPSEELEQEQEHDKESPSEQPATAADDGWRFLISREPGAKFAPEPNRYHLYVSYACPWAHRTVIVRNLKGLQEIIGVTYVHPTWQFTNPGEDDHRGWVFGSKEAGKTFSNTSGIGTFPANWGEEDPLMGANSIREIYKKVDDTTGKYILPVLWDTKLQTIVSNESSEIIRMLNFEFDEFAKNPSINLYPTNLEKDIDAVNKWIYPTFNNGVYRCGLASTQETYDEAIDELTSSFDKLDLILQKQRFLVGDSLTEADVRLFVTLFRYDEVYDVYFKCNTRSVARTPALLNYVRDIYQMSEVTGTCRMDMIKAHYYTSHVELNKYSIIPRGDNFLGLLDQPHHRDSM